LIFSKLKSDFQIIQAENGQEGFEIAVRQLPHLIISDLMMPVMDGLSFCQQIKSDYRTDHIPFILLTVKSSIESRLAGLETGADDYLAKPFNSQELIIRSRNLILQRKNLQARYKQKIEIAPSEIEISSAEKKFIQKAIAQVEQQLDNPTFSIDDFAQQMQLSRVHLHRKLKAITDMNATDFVRNLRLERAAALLAQQSDSVSQIAYQVGFQNLSYFAKCFKEKYAVSPSIFVKKANK
jgi:YesN/AraC family two-component response regulator